jgi:hypothetical protein
MQLHLQTTDNFVFTQELVVLLTSATLSFLVPKQIFQWVRIVLESPTADTNVKVRYYSLYLNFSNSLEEHTELRESIYDQSYNQT